MAGELIIMPIETGLLESSKMVNLSIEKLLFILARNPRKKQGNGGGNQRAIENFWITTLDEEEVEDKINSFFSMS